MWAIAKLTLYRAKDSALLLLLLMGCVLAFFFRSSGVFKVFGDSLESVEPVVPQAGVYMGTAILTGIAVMITLFNATSEIPRDINGRLISILLSKPLSRFQYVMGKFIGTLMISVTFGFSWITILLVSRAFMPGPGQATITLSEAMAQYNCLLALLPTCAFATAISCFFSDMVSMIITSAYIFISFGMAIAPVIASLSGAVLGKLVLLIYLFFPNYLFFIQNKSGVVGTVACLAYALSISLLFVIVGVARFNQGDIYSRD